MKRLAFAGLFLGLALLLTACPTVPLPVNPAECLVGPLQVQATEPPLRLQGLGAFEGEYVPGELLILPRPGFSAQGLRAQGLELRGELPKGLLLVKVPPGEEKSWAEALLRDGVQYVQPNYLYRPLRVPNDPEYRTQKVYMDWVGLESAWGHSTGRGCPPLIAILDTGIASHEDLRTSLYLPPGAGLDVADNDSDPTDYDNGHGLMVAGVLGADTNNRRGIAGTTWGGNLLPIKVFKDGSEFASTATLLQGLRKAQSLGANIINISLGGSDGYDSALADGIADARARGIVLVVAAGNYPTRPPDRPVMFPASLPSVLAVGALDSSKALADFSAYGPELDLVAPGVNLRVPAFGDYTGYSSYSGTSFAAPMVAGVVALYMSKYASTHQAWPTPDQVQLCLEQTAEDLGDTGRDDRYGFGLIRADRVLSDTAYCFP